MEPGHGQLAAEQAHSISAPGITSPWSCTVERRTRSLVQELYLDGQKIAEGKAPVLGAHVGDINIGRSGNTLFHDRKPAEQPGFYFAGRIDDFRILNRSYSAEEVGALRKGK